MYFEWIHFAFNDWIDLWSSDTPRARRSAVAYFNETFARMFASRLSYK